MSNQNSYNGKSEFISIKRSNIKYIFLGLSLFGIVLLSLFFAFGQYSATNDVSLQEKYDTLLKEHVDLQQKHLNTLFEYINLQQENLGLLNESIALVKSNVALINENISLKISNTELQKEKSDPAVQIDVQQNSSVQQQMRIKTYEDTVQQLLN